MKKTAISLSLMLIISIAVWAYWVQKAPVSLHNNKEKPDPSEQVQLTFWRNNGNIAENNAYEKLIASFEDKNPKIKINMKTIPYSNYEIRLRTELANGKSPDIMAIDSPTLALYANNGSLMPIDSLMKKEGNIQDIPKSTLKGLSYEGKLYLAPVAESSIALFYNKQIFKKAGIPFPSGNPNKPMTWDEVITIAKQINNPDKGIIGLDPDQGFGIGEAPAYFKTPFLWQFGASVLSPDSSTANGYLDSKEAKRALKIYQDIYFKYKVASIEVPPRAFEEGKLGMTVLGSWTLKEFAQNANFTADKDFGVAPLPKGTHQATPNGGWALGISSTSTYPKEAWMFIKYVSGYEGMKKYVTITGDLPARFSVAKNIPELNKYPLNILMEQTLYHSRNRPVTPAYSIVSHTIRTLFEDVGLEGKDIDASAEKAVEKINAGIREMQTP
ncbi:ABC transporter substrate-binding protein [Fictibacillus fluitans]|uniref:Sugar ABC transporter substrate-binding protein n=1 Tax=Fictibacillus fluitans TaxID=3058422 RepID=A0ABT8HY13_9BACL|nr:sugar ABC transporter substrate-binding protein [Fictibacillus sp. NE201]MDN4525636.1 sugar ABC transporter substrate-binding protein [Fictibacillus sp. NE201]